MTASVEVREVQEVQGLPWWLILLNGIAALIIGFLLVTSPVTTTVVLVQLLAIYWLISGIFQIIAIFIDSTAWGWNLFSGILGILAGIIILRNHAILGAVTVASIFIIILGIQGLIYGGIAVFQGFKNGTHWGQIILGALSLVFGFYLLTNVLAGVIVLPFVAGIFAIVGGIMAIVAAFRMR